MQCGGIQSEQFVAVHLDHRIRTSAEPSLVLETTSSHFYVNSSFLQVYIGRLEDVLIHARASENNCFAAFCYAQTTHRLLSEETLIVHFKRNPLFHRQVSNLCL